MSGTFAWLNHIIQYQQAWQTILIACRHWGVLISMVIGIRVNLRASTTLMQSLIHTDRASNWN